MTAAYFYAEEGGWIRTRELLKRNRPMALFLDFDGTMAPICDKPSAASLPVECRSLLEDLASRPGVFISIVSGRAMEDIKAKIGIEGICYIANHGFEIFSERFQWMHPQAAARKRELKALCKDLSERLAGFEGAMVEDKGFTLSIHYRLLKDRSVTELKEIVTGVAQNTDDRFKIAGGKKVVEIRPALDWDKGKAVMAVLDGLYRGKDALAIYIGDDRTDEDAFRQLKSAGITIKIGRQPTCAEFFMEDTAEVSRFLEDVSLFF